MPKRGDRAAFLPRIQFLLIAVGASQWVALVVTDDPVSLGSDQSRSRASASPDDGVAGGLPDGQHVVAIDSHAVLGKKDQVTELRARVASTGEALGRPLKLLVGKPGLDGHSNGAEQIALRARDCGIEVVYQGIRLSPEQIAASALEESVHVVGLSILSGAHIRLVGEVRRLMDAEGCRDIPIVVGGIIPAEDIAALKAAGVARIYTPKDFEITGIIADIADVATEGFNRAA